MPFVVAIPTVYKLLGGSIALLITSKIAMDSASKAPEDGSLIDTLNDGTNAAPKIAKYTAIAGVAAAVVAVSKMRKGK